MPAFQLGGKVALVTGAARGIGLETARLLHARGASVALVDLDQAAADSAAAQVGERTLALGADVTDRDAMVAAVEATVERFGGLDLPIANAGVAGPPATARAMDEEVWERVLAVDLLGVWRTVRPALDHVVARRGHVVVVSSVYAWANGVGNSPYATAKAGVEALGRTLRVELAPAGASATVAHFGFVDTEMVRGGLADPVAQRAEELIPGFLKRRISAAQAAAALVAGIERRAPRVIAPGMWRVPFVLRGLLGPGLDRLMEHDRRLAGVIRAGDAEERAGLRGGLDRTAGSV